MVGLRGKAEVAGTLGGRSPGRPHPNGPGCPPGCRGTGLLVVAASCKVTGPGTRDTLTLKRVGGWITPAATWKACHVVWDEAGGIKPSCNFHFGCLKQVDNINFGGCL